MTEFETILTSVELKKEEKKKFKLPKEEQDRVERLIQRTKDKESGKLTNAELDELNPDGCKLKYRTTLEHSSYSK